MVAGTTETIEADLAQRLLPMLKTAVEVAVSRGAALVTGGTDAGVFHLVSRILRAATPRPHAVVGVVPDALVASPADPGGDDESSDVSTPVAPHLTALVRVPGDAWGDETPALSAVVSQLAGELAVVVLLVGGGQITRREIVEHLTRGRAVVALAGSGRLADAVARAKLGGHADADPRQSTTAPASDDLGSLIATGDVHVVALEHGPEHLGRVLASLLTPAPRTSLRDSVALLTALPRFRFRPEAPAALIDPGVTQRYPQLQPQVADADRLIFPVFAECDVTAQAEQNRYRWFTLLALTGGLLTTVFGALQAWLQSTPWPGVLVATLGAATSALTAVARRQGAQQNYLTARLRAERLRSLYFEYVATAPAPDDAGRQKRLRRLRQEVARIQSMALSP